jgi:hypothetical protein
MEKKQKTETVPNGRLEDEWKFPNGTFGIMTRFLDFREVVLLSRLSRHLERRVQLHGKTILVDADAGDRSYDAWFTQFGVSCVTDMDIGLIGSERHLQLTSLCPRAVYHVMLLDSDVSAATTSTTKVALNLVLTEPRWWATGLQCSPFVQHLRMHAIAPKWTLTHLLDWCCMYTPHIRTLNASWSVDIRTVTANLLVNMPSRSSSVKTLNALTFLRLGNVQSDETSMGSTLSLTSLNTVCPALNELALERNHCPVWLTSPSTATATLKLTRLRLIANGSNKWTSADLFHIFQVCPLLTDLEIEDNGPLDYFPTAAVAGPSRFEKLTIRGGEWPDPDTFKGWIDQKRLHQHPLQTLVLEDIVGGRLSSPCVATLLATCFSTLRQLTLQSVGAFRILCPAICTLTQLSSLRLPKTDIVLSDVRLFAQSLVNLRALSLPHATTLIGLPITTAHRDDLFAVLSQMATLVCLELPRPMVVQLRIWHVDRICPQLGLFTPD